MNVVKKYWDTVYLVLLILLPAACMAAGMYYTFWWNYGFYPTTPRAVLIIFDISTVVYMICAIVLIIIKQRGNHLKDRMYTIIKGYIAVVLAIQYTFLMFSFPEHDTWCGTFLFLFFILISLDFRYTCVNIGIYTILATAAHLVFPAEHLSDISGYDYKSLWYRIIIYGIFCTLTLVLSYFIDGFLKRLQRDEDESEFYSMQQISYYQNLDLMDKELRKFRHDIVNHFLCMQDLLEKEEYPELKTYFSDLMQTYSSRDQIYFSGNIIVDSVLNYNINHTCNDNVHPAIYGKLPEIETITSMDLCTVFSNILSNAIKGANSQSGRTELVVSFQGGDRYFDIRITNDRKGRPDDTGSTGRNHGHGLRNVQEVVDKYNGILCQTYDENKQQFTTQVTLPI